MGKLIWDNESAQESLFGTRRKEPKGEFEQGGSTGEQEIEVPEVPLQSSETGSRKRASPLKNIPREARPEGST